MISSDVIFGSLNSRTDLNLIFTHADKGSPDVHTEYINVPGRTPVDLSELILGFPQYQMRKMTIEFEFIGPDWQAERELLLAKLHGRKMKIRFMNDPNWNYTGRCLVDIQVNASTLHVTVTVNAEPFKKLVSETPVVVSGADSITNSYDFPAYPLIRVNGSGAGTMTIGNQTVTFDDIDGYVDVDSELMDCYKGLTNCNNLVRLSQFPRLDPGANGVSFGGGVTSLVITPRWRTL